jgi:HAD superfamily hydrolase (TIGR01549 family)
VVAARNLGLRVAVATNPIFPRIAVDHRIAWAGLDGIDFDLVTTYEHMRACKPQADYFVQVADELDVDPAECLMVGDDPRLDMPAADVGMRTFYVGSGNRVAADYRGTLTDLAALLPRLV